jgi:hypothetical protein
MTQDRDDERALLEAIHARRAELAKLLERFSSHWEFEDPVCRFYHQSFKVFALQHETQEIVAILQSLAPRPLPRPAVRGNPPCRNRRRCSRAGTQRSCICTASVSSLCQPCR